MMVPSKTLTLSFVALATKRICPSCPNPSSIKLHTQSRTASSWGCSFTSTRWVSHHQSRYFIYVIITYVLIHCFLSFEVPGVDNLAFAGIADIVGSLFPAVEMQARLISAMVPFPEKLRVLLWKT